MSRCKACNRKLSTDDLKRKGLDIEFCSECRFQSNRKYSIHDHQYDHENVTNVQVDGSSLSLDLSYLDDV